MTNKVQAQKETLGFEAEVAQILDLVANSLYSDREIFLRELISNASDAADKLRYQALNDAALYEGDSELKIWVDFDKASGTVTVRDNGIGMTREEAILHLGTIAKSGTKAFRDMLTADKKSAGDSNLIGQFGVGFYSAFVVSDKVTVNTRKAGTEATQGVCWESDGKGKYTVNNIEKAAHGTEIILHLKKRDDEFLDATRLKHIIRKYSDHILLPIEMLNTPEKKEGEEEAPEATYETVNQANALWTLPKSKISDEEYEGLYKHISHDFEGPLAWNHSKVEGRSEYTSLLFVPKRAPFDLWNREGQRGLKLYVRRVFIMDDAEHFLPMYLRFVKGIVDSNDLPLNMSRELLQRDTHIEKIKTGCVKKILGMLENMAKKEADKYAEFWKTFGQVLKEGPGEDMPNKDRVAGLLRFSSTQDDSETQSVSLADYVSRMKDDQEKIYYVLSDNFNAAKNSPLLEVFREKGIEVLLLSDRVDEWLMAHLTEFDGKSLQSISKGDIDFDKDDAAAQEEKQKSEEVFESVLKQFKEVLGDQVKDVRLTTRLKDSPACVVYDEGDMSGHMQRLMAAAGQAMPASKPILELNAQHKLLLKAKSEQDDTRFGKLANVLLGQSLLAEGETLTDPAAFVRDMNALI